MSPGQSDGRELLPNAEEFLIGAWNATVGQGPQETRILGFDNPPAFSVNANN
jgi:hypothetical protein